ncbi:neutral zinc metallopeptidase [Siccirubricoccus sp. G192]|uniref:KPN_02809 family neutral zinc metallopeptidase n=1 Tax=Siccirubricoccus sp. G192 TaxID=2849651 RepID=UPI001C2C1AAE|nr:neutral zinc metallopeptidase [Siccirubricoccus sp. G192]MBV1797718.1 zinc metallopeptidase [Siccirubricoccus sp. G192]
MRLGGERESGNIEDRRGGGVPIGVAGGGIGTIVLVVLALLFGVDPRVVLQGGDDTGQMQAPTARYDAPPPAGQQDGMRRFVAQVLATTEDVWGAVFQANGRRYVPPHLVLFSGAVQSACGTASTAVGPFYCPGDQKVYLDLGFFRDMERKLGAPGDFAQAYVIAHEVGHHVQTQLGITQRVEALRARAASPAEGAALSVRVELQADCFAGVWANHADQARNILERGDIEEGMNAAAAVGDDRLQRRAQGYVVPESFTHGSSAQRVRWFRRGLETGEVRQCDTFGTDRL